MKLKKFQIANFEIIIAIVLIIIGLAYGGFEIWLRTAANGSDLCEKARLAGYNDKIFKANVLFYMATRTGYKFAWYVKGHFHNNHQEFDKALECFKKGAEEGESSSMIMVGEHYLEKNNDAEAAKWFTKAIKAGDPEGYCKLGLIYQKQKKYADALRCYKKAENREYSYSYKCMGDLYCIQKKYTEAIKSYEKLITSGYDKNLGYSWMAEAYSKWKKYDKAIELYQKLVNNGEYYYFHELAKIYLSQRKYNKAIKVYEEACAMNKSASYYGEIAKIYQKLYQYDKAIETLEKGIAYGQNDLYTELGALYQEIKEYDKAIEMYRKSCSEKDCYGLVYAARVYEKQHNDDEALNCYHEAIKKGDNTIYWALAEHYLRKKDYETALRYFNTYGKLNDFNKTETGEGFSIDYKSDTPRCYSKIGEVYEQQNKLSEAIKWYQKAIDRNYKTDMWRLAGIYEKQKKLSLALKTFKRAAKTKSIEGLIELGLFYERHNKPKKSKNIFDSLLWNEKYYAMLILAEKYENAEQFDKAINWLKNALTCGSLNEDNLKVKIGDLYFKTKNYQKAIEWHQKAVEDYHLESLEQLAKAYKAMGNIKESEKWQKKCESFNKKKFGANYVKKN